MFMNIRRLYLVLVAAVAMMLVTSCGPEGIEPKSVVTPATRATCILLRAFVSDGKLQEVCATAEELAPLVEEIIAEREEAPPGEQRSSAATVAFSLPAPSRKVPRRRCIQWQYLSGGDGGPGDAGSRSGNAEGGGRGQGGIASVDDGGQRSDGGGQWGDGGRAYADAGAARATP